jgi:DNA-binding YbaB/EbfC family protein
MEEYMTRGGIGNIMKQAQQMQRRMAQLQEELANKQVEASAGGGMVTATVSGKQQLLGLKIDPAAVDPDDVEMLQDLVTAAVNEALKQSQQMASEEMSKLTGGMSIPGLC